MDNKKIAIILATLLFVSAGSNCPSSLPVIGGDICDTSYFDPETGVGVNPPAGWIGPFDRQSTGGIGWRAPGNTLTPNIPDFELTIEFESRSLEEIGAGILDIYADGNSVESSSAATATTAGRDAWMVIDRKDSLTQVWVYFKVGNTRYMATGFGSTVFGTNDRFMLIEACRSLCLGVQEQT